MATQTQSVVFELGNQSITLETGHIAKQADASILAKMGDTYVLATVAAKQTPTQADFFPLTCNYIEKYYASGKVPGGFLKRESKPSDRETLISRLIDRPIRPSFPKAFKHEVQVIVQLLSYDPNAADPDTLAIIAASAACSLSGMPFIGPIAAARVGMIDGKTVINPNAAELKKSQLDLVVAGSKDAILMVESEANQLTEEQMIDAVFFAHDEMQKPIKAIEELKQKVGEAHQWWTEPEASTPVDLSAYTNDFNQAFAIHDKKERLQTVKTLKDKIILNCVNEETSEQSVLQEFHKIEKNTVRQNVIQNKPRLDGRDKTTVRPIDINIKYLPRPHGSALFTRGSTQALVAVTLGGDRDAQLIDGVTQSDEKEPFMLHYNFPPFCVGEVGFMGSPKRREIGHGRLAKRALAPVLPTTEDFPYVLRLVSEVLESNGSSSMATVCGGSLALMDAGVPIKAPVAGIAMGLIKEENDYAILTDILGDEDHLGDMDFKVAGTSDGITALQMDIKIAGITRTIMTEALSQAKQARLHILNEMNNIISEPRTSISQHAPTMLAFEIKTDKIREVIGRGGATIREIQEKFEVNVDINDDGQIKVTAPDGAKASEAKEYILKIVSEAEIGDIYSGKVVKIMEFGAFVNILPGKDGFLHISQIANERINDINDHLNEGQTVQVKVVEIDRNNRVKLSIKEAISE